MNWYQLIYFIKPTADIVALLKKKTNVRFGPKRGVAFNSLNLLLYCKLIENITM